MNASEYAAAQWTRATGAGLDPHEYRRVTERLESVADWGPAFRRTAHEYVRRAESAGSRLSAGQHLLTAARWFHVATLSPYEGARPTGVAEAEAADRAAVEASGRAAVETSGCAAVTGADRAAVTGAGRVAAKKAGRAGVEEADHVVAEADDALARGLTLLEPGARRVSGAEFTGWLRGPADARGTVIVVPGLDSAKEEFLELAAALLERGLAVFAMDGPGQGALKATTTKRADYHQVIGQVIDALGVNRVGLSLGGYYAAETAAWEPRVAATATVSGPFRLDWAELPQPVRDLLIQRAGGADAARAFADQVDLADLAPRIEIPLLTVDGGQDVIPGVTNGEPLARLAPRGTHLSVPHGDHLLGNARPDWLPLLTDWITQTLTGPRER
ncbi:serine aminopeptidase domain-containing protein [Streptomyces sp. NPDC017254]|uniref:serine aminopeptidase domain-containing protein n=1 Tax=unclassified Streptomyces TaxID=2593676 RepID=UPI0037A8B735